MGGNRMKNKHINRNQRGNRANDREAKEVCVVLKRSKKGKTEAGGQGGIWGIKVIAMVLDTQHYVE